MAGIELLSQKGCYSRVAATIVKDRFRAFTDLIVPLLETCNHRIEEFAGRLYKALDKVLGDKAIPGENYPNTGSIVRTSPEATRLRRDASRRCLDYLRKSFDVWDFVGKDYDDHGKFFNDFDTYVIHDVRPTIEAVTRKIDRLREEIEIWYDTHHKPSAHYDEVHHAGITELYTLFKELLDGQRTQAYIKRLKLQPLVNRQGFFRKDTGSERGGDYKITAARLTANACTLVGIETINEKDVTNYLSKKRKAKNKES